jgi:hypothetical protein
MTFWTPYIDNKSCRLNMHTFDNLVNVVRRMCVLNILPYNIPKLKKYGTRVCRCPLIWTLSAATHTNYTRFMRVPALPRDTYKRLFLSVRSSSYLINEGPYFCYIKFNRKFIRSKYRLVSKFNSSSWIRPRLVSFVLLESKLVHI